VRSGAKDGVGSNEEGDPDLGFDLVPQQVDDLHVKVRGTDLRADSAILDRLRASG
jgi:hypothetical protein